MKKAKKLTSILAASFMFATTFATVVVVNSSDTSVDSVDGLNLVNEDRAALVKYANRETTTSSTLGDESAYYSIRLGENSGLRFKYVITKDMISAAFSDADVDFSNYSYGVYVAKTSSLKNATLVDSIENDTVAKLKVEAKNKVVSDNDVTFAAVLVGFENEIQFNNDYSAIAYVSDGTTTHYSAESSYSYMKAVEYYLDENNEVYDMLTEVQKTTLTAMKTDNATSYRVVEESGSLNLYQYSIKNDTNLGEPIATTTKPAVSTATFTVNTKDKGSYTGNESKLYEFTNSGNVYTSSNKGIGSSISSMVVTATSSGTITFEYKVQGEGSYTKYDYLNVYHNSKLEIEKSTDGNSSKTITVEEGDTLTFTYRKDVSGDVGDDCAVITIWGSTYTTSVVSFDTMQGGVINPMIAVSCALTASVPTPTRTGYYFDGWFTSKAFTEDSRVTDSTSFDSDTILYAHWIPMSEANVLMGSYYGFNVEDDDTSTSSSYILSVDFKGNYEAKYSSYGSSNGTLSSYDETNGTFTSANGTVHYDENSNLVVLAHSASHSSSSTYSVYVVGSTSSISSSNVKFAAFDSGAYRLVSYISNGTTTNVLIDAINNEVYFDVTAYGINGNQLSNADSVSNENVVTIKHNDTVIKVFGYTSDGLVSATDPTGIYSVTGTDKTVKLLGAGYLIYDGYSSSSKIKYEKDTTNDNVYTASSSSSYNYTFTFDHTAKTVIVTENKCHVTYNWMGHEVSGVSNQTEVWKGSWLYSPSKPNVDSYVDEDGTYYVFKGWYKDSDLTTKYLQIRLESDITLYAKWVEGYKVTFDANGGTCSTSEDVVASGETASLPTVSHTEKVFTYWTLNGEIFEEDTPITSNITLVANFEEAPFYVGKYVGYNADHSNVGTQSKTDGLSYNITLSLDYSVSGKTKTTWSKDNYNASTGILAFENGAKFYVFESSTGIKVGFAHYSFSTSSEMMWDDYGVYASYTDDNTKPKFDVIYWNNGFNKLFKITVGDKVTYVYSDGENKKIYVDVEFTNFAGSAIAYSDIYSNNALANELVIKANDAVVAKYKATNETKYGYQSDDGHGGTYTGTLNGVDATVVLDGYGSATVNGTETTYSYESGIFTVVVDGTTYKFETNDKSLTQILDGKQGTYTGTEGDLVLTGWAEGTLAGVNITYTVSGNLITITKGEEEIIVSLNNDNTYEIAQLSIFAGYTFTGKYYDSSNDQQSLEIVFDETAQISGVLYGGGKLFYFYFTGEFDGTTLVMTITKAVDNDQVGKTITATLSGNTLIITDTTIANNGAYTFDNQGSATCADFNA